MYAFNLSSLYPFSFCFSPHIASSQMKQYSNINAELFFLHKTQMCELRKKWTNATAARESAALSKRLSLICTVCSASVNQKSKTGSFFSCTSRHLWHTCKFVFHCENTYCIFAAVQLKTMKTPIWQRRKSWWFALWSMLWF